MLIEVSELDEFWVGLVGRSMNMTLPLILLLTVSF